MLGQLLKIMDRTMCCDPDNPKLGDIRGFKIIMNAKDGIPLEPGGLPVSYEATSDVFEVYYDDGTGPQWVEIGRL